MKRLLIAAFFALVIVPSALAFNVAAPDQTFSVPMLTSKQIDISITSAINETITASIVDSKTWISLSPSQIQTSPGQAQSVGVFISPGQDTLEGLYKVTVLFESLNSGELKKADVYAYVSKAEIVNLDKIVVTGRLEPLGYANVSFYVRNLKSASVQGARLVANVTTPGGAMTIIDTQVPDIDPSDVKVVSVIVPLVKGADAGNYEVRGEVQFSNERSSDVQAFYVQKKAIIVQTVEKAQLLFGYAKRVTITNNGNTPGDATFSDSVAKLDAAFFSGNLPYSVSDLGFSWVERAISPGESRVIEYKIDYSPIFIFLLVIIIVIWLYFRKFRTVRVKKYIMQRKHIVQGEEFTVAVEAMNATGRKIDLDVHDFVPAVFDVKDADGPKPSKKKSRIGAELTWSAKGFHQGESRIFTYKIIPVFGVSGSIKLPSAAAMYLSGSRTIETRSLPTSIGVAETPSEEKTWKKFARVKKK